jgi:hypothetical protein
MIGEIVIGQRLRDRREQEGNDRGYDGWRD